MSFDAVSLFTFIPTDLIIQVAHCKLEFDALFLRGQASLNVDDIIDLLHLEVTFLPSRGRVYKQVRGAAKGSSVSVVVTTVADWEVPEALAEGAWPALKNSDVVASPLAEHALTASYV